MVRNSGSIAVTPFRALEKIQKWCAYQERSQFETRKKLREYGISSEDAEAIIARLISENYLNEERFAILFASGRFRIKRWGKGKIIAALKQHQVSEYCIRRAMEQLPQSEYTQSLEKVIEKKIKQVQGDRRKVFHTVLRYAVSKGYESDLVIEQLNLILKQTAAGYEFRSEE